LGPVRQGIDNGHGERGGAEKYRVASDPVRIHEIRSLRAALIEGRRTTPNPTWANPWQQRRGQAGRSRFVGLTFAVAS